MGLLIGLVMVAQTLYALVLDRYDEFATLKAIGTPERKVYLSLFVQASIIGIAGITIGYFLVLGIEKIGSSPKAPIVIPVWLSIATSILVLGICLLSALLPYYKVRRIDPMTVLQS